MSGTSIIAQIFVPLRYTISFITKSCPEVIKREFILKLKIKRSDWLLADMCPQVANRYAFV